MTLLEGPYISDQVLDPVLATSSLYALDAMSMRAHRPSSFWMNYYESMSAERPRPHEPLRDVQILYAEDQKGKYRVSCSKKGRKM